MSFADRNSELLHAYLRTTYSAETPLGVVRIRIGETAPLLDELLNREKIKEWAFLSASNPGSRQITDEENASRHLQLGAMLSEKGYRFFEGYGIGDNPEWKPEKSVLILGITLNAASHLARHFRQNAFVCGAQGEPARLTLLPAPLP